MFLFHLCQFGYSNNLLLVQPSMLLHLSILEPLFVAYRQHKLKRAFGRFVPSDLAPGHLSCDQRRLQKVPRKKNRGFQGASRAFQGASGGFREIQWVSGALFDLRSPGTPLKPPLEPSKHSCDL